MLSHFFSVTYILLQILSFLHLAFSIEYMVETRHTSTYGAAAFLNSSVVPYLCPTVCLEHWLSKCGRWACSSGRSRN